jgi:hypothetical protein
MKNGKPWARKRRMLRAGATVGLVTLVTAIAVLASSGSSGGINSAQRVVNALSATFHEKYTSVEDGTCSPLGNGDSCEFKIEGEWHDDVWAEPHPDGSISWEDTSSGRGSTSGELSAAEVKR